MPNRLDDLPTELLLNILSLLDDLEPLSSSNRTLSAVARDYRARELRTRISRIHQADLDLLVRIWPPPTFFGQGTRRRAVPRPHELMDVLCDPNMLPLVESYISCLEHRAQTGRDVARHLVRMVGFGSQPCVLTYAATLVFHLWSVEQRHGHDIDGYLLALGEGQAGGGGGPSTFSELCVRDPYLAGLPQTTRDDLVASYQALDRHLQPPFRPSGGGEGLWLQRVILQVSREPSFVSEMRESAKVCNS